MERPITNPLAAFWYVRTFLLIRNPELLEEWMEIIQKGKPALMAEFLDRYFPLPDAVWDDIELTDVRKTLMEHYPYATP